MLFSKNSYAVFLKIAMLFTKNSYAVSLKQLCCFLKIPLQILKLCNSLIIMHFLLIGMQPWRPSTTVEDGDPEFLARDAVQVNYFSLFPRVVFQVTESSAHKDEGTTLLSERRDKRTQRHRVKSKQILITCEYYRVSHSLPNPAFL